MFMRDFLEQELREEVDNIFHIFRIMDFISLFSLQHPLMKVEGVTTKQPSKLDCVGV
jgi:hypothetical protein